MPKRQPKPEPITPEEVMGSPALQGFDTFLRHRAPEGPPPGNGGAGEPAERAGSGEIEPTVSPIHELPIGYSLTGESPTAESPTAGSPPTYSPIGLIAEIAEIKPGPKIRRAVKVQDGHSTGEQLVYQALWNAASVETSETRLIRIGYGGLQSLCGLDKTNCKDNIQSLVRKLALEVVSPFSVQRNQGNVYRVFSASAIMKRRKAAGMEWVIRNKGVRFVDSPIGD